MTQQQTMTASAWGQLAALSLLWGGTFLNVRVALDALGPLTIVAHRVFWAALALWLVVLVARLPIPRGRRVLIGFIGMGILNNAIPFTLQAWGQLHIESGLTAILNAGTAVWGVLIAALFMADERLTLPRLVGVMLGFLGVATAIGLQSLTAFDPRNIAQLAVVASTISYALAGVWARRFLAGVHPLVAAAGMLTASTALMVPVAWTVEGPIQLALDLHTVLALAYLTLLATALAYALYYRVLAAAGSGNVMLCTLLVAPVAIVLGTLFLGETLASRALLGFGVLALGLLILSGRLPLRR
ncbi:MAG: DMT family transporter [Pseudomonadota bacterium]